MIRGAGEGQVVSTLTGYQQNLEGAQLRNKLTMFTRIVFAAQEVGGGVRRTRQDDGLQ